MQDDLGRITQRQDQQDERVRRLEVASEVVSQGLTELRQNQEKLWTKAEGRFVALERGQADIVRAIHEQQLGIEGKMSEMQSGLEGRMTACLRDMQTAGSDAKVRVMGWTLGVAGGVIITLIGIIMRDALLR